MTRKEEVCDYELETFSREIHTQKVHCRNGKLQMMAQIQED